MSKYVIDKIRGGRAYGPYYRKDNRQHIVIVLPNDKGEYLKDSKKSSVSYPKWLMEQKLGRVLDPNEETIDHKNDDFTDNSDNNLRIMTRSQHTKEDVKRLESVELTCVWCSAKFRCNPSKRIQSKSHGTAGPFCSKRCSGIYGTEIQKGKEKLTYKEIPKRTYFKLKHLA